MKLLLTTVAAITITAQAAMAFEVTGGDVMLQWGHNRDYNQSLIGGNIAFGIAGGLGVQVGLKFADYSGNTSTRSGEAQLTYAMGGTNLGAFIGRETFSAGNDYTYYGVAVGYKGGPLALSAAISDNEADNSPWRSTDLFLDGEYSFGERSGLLAGLHTTHTSSGFSENYAYFGVRYEVVPNVDLAATYGRLDWSTGQQGVATLGVTYNFGQGATFGQHSYTDLFPSN